MTRESPFAAELLEAGASAYAGYATSLLFERRPEAGEQLGVAAFSSWKGHLTERILELAAALAAGEPRLFLSRVVWSRRASHARKLSDENLRASLVCLREVLAEELPEPAREPAREVLDQALASFEAPVDLDTGLDPEEPEQKLALQYLLAVLEGRGREAVAHVLAAVEGGLATERAYTGVLLPAQREVGRMWHLGEISIAEEHFVTSTTQRTMSILCHRVVPESPHGTTVIAAAVAGNRHDIGLWALTDFFEMAGWRSIGLGADVPAADIAAAARQFGASLVLLSAALATQLKTVRYTIETVRAGVEGPIKIMVGGTAFAEAPDLWQALGADGYAPAVGSAVETAARLIGLEPR